MKAANIFKYILLTIGLTLLVGAIYIYLDKKNFLENAIITEGTVVDVIKTDYQQNYSRKYNIGKKNRFLFYPIISFTTLKGRQIKFDPSLSSYTPSRIGEKFEIIYDPENPNDAKIKKYESVWAIPLAMSFFSFTSFLMILILISKTKKLKYLYENGYYIETQFDYVLPIYNLNRTTFYQIYTKRFDPYSNKLQIFKSTKILSDPTDILRNKTIKVLVHPTNPNEYHMDISFLR